MTISDRSGFSKHEWIPDQISNWIKFWNGPIFNDVKSAVRIFIIVLLSGPKSGPDQYFGTLMRSTDWTRLESGPESGLKIRTMDWILKYRTENPDRAPKSEPDPYMFWNPTQFKSFSIYGIQILNSPCSFLPIATPIPIPIAKVKSNPKA